MRIGVPRSGTRISKENESWNMLIYSIQWTWFPNEYGMEAWVLMGALGVIYKWFLYLLLLPVEYCSWFYDIIWYILLSILSWRMISTQYLCLYWPLLVWFLFVICGVQQTYRRLQLYRNSSQSSPRQISGWAIVSSLDKIFFFMSWCLEVLAWTICLVTLAS